MKAKLTWVLLLYLSIICCNESQRKNGEPVPDANNQGIPADNRARPAKEVHINDIKPAESVPNPRLPSNSRRDNVDCGIVDGTYNSNVDYYNPKTGFRNSYTLEVIVENCEVIEIDFPKGGWLDGDHIDPTEINDEGTADVEDDLGRSFEVQLNKENIESKDDRDNNVKDAESENDEPDNSDRPEDSDDQN